MQIDSKFRQAMANFCIISKFFSCGLKTGPLCLELEWESKQKSPVFRSWLKDQSYTNLDLLFSRLGTKIY